MIKEHLITVERLKEVVEYDPDTGIFTWKLHRGRVTKGTTAGAVRTHGYIGIRIDGRLYMAHRLAWLYVHGRLPKEEIDHINLQSDDNRICNLREATHRQNLRNTSLRSHSKSGFKGVRFDARRKEKPYHAKIVYDGKDHHLGNYDTPEEAHEAYVKAAVKAFGEFARTK